MPDEKPQFISTDLQEKKGRTTKKKVIRPRTTATKTKKTTRTTRIRTRKTSTKTSAKKSDFDKNIEKKLTSIYEDGNGKMPDMKKIKIKKSHPVLGCFLSLIIIGGLVAAAAWAGFFVLPTNDNFSENKIEIKIEGPRDTTLGATTTYSITFKNNQKVTLKNVLLNINYPEGFEFLESSTESKNTGHTEWEIGTIGANKEGVLTITGKPYGSAGQKSSWRIFFNYQPENLNSKLQKVVTYKTQISSVPVSLLITGPDKISVGNDAVYSFIVTKTGDWWPKKMELRPSFPNNFYITSSTPIDLDKNNKWIFEPSKYVNTSSTLETVVFTVSGKFGESPEETMPIKTDLFLPINTTPYKIAESSLETNLLKNNVNLNLVINGSFKNFSSQPGDILNTTINLKNSSKEDLHNVVVKISFDAPVHKKTSVMNWIELKDEEDGLIRGENLSKTVRRGEITWSYKRISELKKIKSGKDISFDIRLPIKDSGIFDLISLKEYRINVLSNVGFEDFTGAKDTISSNPITITMNSDLKFESRDKITKSDSGKELHNIKWIITNNFHPLKNVKLTADLYGDVSWVMTDGAPAGSVNYDKTTKKLVWTIDNVNEEMDTLALPFTITINQKNPSQDLLMSKVHIEATDTTTGEKIEFMGEDLPLIKE